MYNEGYHKILAHIFNDKAYTEEQKGAMICSLGYAIADEQLLPDGSMSTVHKRLFSDILFKGGFFIMNPYFEIAKRCNDSEYMLNILNSLNEEQKEKYVMLFLLFISDCNTRGEDLPHMHKIMELTMNAINVSPLSQYIIGTQMASLL